MDIKINPFLYSILINLKIDNFTVAEGRDALLLESNKFIEDREARKIVDRLLPIAVKNGLLSREERGVKGKKIIIYSKTELFFEIKFTSKNKPLFFEKEKTKGGALSISELEKELFELEIDLHSSISEATEYKSLQKRLPELGNSLQNKYLSAKKKSSKLLGKVSALESTIELIKAGASQY